MKFKLIITLLLLLLSVLPISVEAASMRWLGNSTSTVGLSSTLNAATFFYKDGVYQAISLDTSNPYIYVDGWSWDGTWTQNNSVDIGIADITNEGYLPGYSPDEGIPSIVNDSGTWMFTISYHGWSGIYSVGFGIGYIWNGTQWVSNGSVTSGISFGTEYPTFSMFEMDGDTDAFFDNTHGCNPYNGAPYDPSVLGYTFGGSSWSLNNTLNDGLTGLLPNVRTAVYNKDNENYLLTARWGLYCAGGLPHVEGFRHTASGWESNASVMYGLSQTSGIYRPSIINISGKWSLFDSALNGYTSELNNIPTVPNISLPENSSSGYSALLNVTWNASTDNETEGDTITYQWQIASDIDFTNVQDSGVTSYTYVSSGISIPIGGHWVRVRSYDQIDYSDWSTAIYWTSLDGTRYVNITGWWLEGGSFNVSTTPISAAISNSSSYDTVYIYNGTYTDYKNITINNFTITGEGRDLVIITTPSTSTPVFTVSAANVNISSLTVHGATNRGTTGGIKLDSTSAIIDDVNASLNGDGIRITGNNNTVKNSIITQNTGTTSGIYIGGSYNNVSNNTITKNGYGVRIYITGSYNTILNNNITDNSVYGVMLGIVGIGTEYQGNYNYFIGGTISNNTIDFYNKVSSQYAYGSNDYYQNVNFTNRSIQYYCYGGIGEYYNYWYNITEDNIIIRSNLITTGGGTYNYRSFWYELQNITQNNVTLKTTPISLPSTLNHEYIFSNLTPYTSYGIIQNNIKTSSVTTDSVGTTSTITTGVTQTTLTLLKKEAFLNSLSTSPSDVRTGENLYINTNISINDGSSISSLIVNITYPDNTYHNKSMSNTTTYDWQTTLISSETSLSGIYTINTFYITDSDTISYIISNSSTFAIGSRTSGDASVPVVTSAPTTAPTPVPTEYKTETEPEPETLIPSFISDIPGTLGNLFIIKEIHAEIGKIIEKIVTVVQSINWFSLLGIYVGTFIILFIISNNSLTDNLLDTSLYGTIFLITIQVVSMFGINMYFLNTILQSELPAYMFISVSFWGGLFTIFINYIMEHRK